MNKTLYWIIGIILVTALGYAGFRLMMKYQNGTMYNSQPSNSPGSYNQSSSPQYNTAPSTGINKTDTSNQQLDQDLQNIEGSLNKLNSDQSIAGQTVTNQSSENPSQ